jgi:hypothetical protein
MRRLGILATSLQGQPQTPLRQRSYRPQELPHRPQFPSSVSRFTQLVPHMVSSHTHAPISQ